MAPMLARLLPVLLVCGGIMLVLEIIGRFRGSPIKLTLVGFLLLIIVALVIVIIWMAFMA